MTEVLLISGKARHGKDTTAEIIERELKANGKRVMTSHFADLVKYICKTFFGWDGEKDEHGRTLLQYVGTDVVREKEPNYWVNFIADILVFFGENWDYVIVPDCRFYNEVFGLRYYGFPTKHIRVVRPNFDNGLTEEQKNHPSETSLDTLEPDLYIYNDSTIEGLEDTVKNLVEGLLND